jgi:hypothetical protein
MTGGKHCFIQRHDRDCPPRCFASCGCHGWLVTAPPGMKSALSNLTARCMGEGAAWAAVASHILTSFGCSLGV